MARRRKESANKMDMSLDDIIAMNKKTRGVGARGRGRGRGAGGGGARPVAQRRPWNRQKLTGQMGGGVTSRQQRVQQIQRRARMTVIRKRLAQGPKPVVSSSSGSRAGFSVRGRGWGRGRGRGRGRGWQRQNEETTEEEKEEEFAEPESSSAVMRGRGRGRGRVILGRGRGRGRGVGRGRLTTEAGPSSSPAPRPGSRLKIIRSLKGRGKTVIAIKRRLSTGSLQHQEMTTPTRGRAQSRGRNRGRGSLSVGSTPVAGPSEAKPLRVSVVKEQTFEPVGVELSPDFAATHHTQKSLNARFSQSPRTHVQRMVMTDGRNVQYS